MMRLRKVSGVLACALVCFGSSAAVATYVIAPAIPNNGGTSVNTAPLVVADGISWDPTDAPIYNAYSTFTSGLPMGTVPTLASHQFQTGYPTLLQASLQDRYTFSPAIPTGTTMTVTITFQPSAGSSIGTSTTFKTK